MDVWAAIRSERQALVGDLEVLEEDQWDVASLCGEWRVRDVVAHLARAARGMGVGSFAAGLLRHGFNFNKWNAEAARVGGQQSPDRLIADYRAVIDEQRTLPGAKPLDMLCDTIVHGQDIRRPLGLHRDFPGDVMLTALEHLKANTFPFGTKKRLAGFQLVATDVAWTHGDGPDVRGSAETLLLAMTGRTASFRDLFGLGREQFEGRFKSH